MLGLEKGKDECRSEMDENKGQNDKSAAGNQCKPF